MEYTAQFTYDCLWRVDGVKRVCTGGHESDGYPCLSQFIKGITEYSLTNFRSGTLNLSKLACYFS